MRRAIVRRGSWPESWRRCGGSFAFERVNIQEVNNAAVDRKMLGKGVENCREKSDV